MPTTVNVTQYRGQRVENGVPAQVAQEGALARGDLSTTGSGNVQSLVLDETTRLIRVVALAAIRYSLNGAAGATSTYLPAGVVEFVGVSRGMTLSVREE